MSEGRDGSKLGRRNWSVSDWVGDIGWRGGGREKNI